MAETTEFRQPDAARHPDGVHRDQWTRPIYPQPDDYTIQTKCTLCGVHVPGRPFTRVTRFIDVLDRKDRLERWYKRQVVKGLALKDYLVLRAANALDAEDPKAESDNLDKVATQAAQAAGAYDRNNLGSELHRTLEMVLRGDKPHVPEKFQPDVKALYDAFAEHGLNASPHDLEISVVLDGVIVQKTAYGLGGKFDVLLRLNVPCPRCGRWLRIGDFKTGRVDYGADKFRMQLAAYALGQRIDPVTGHRSPIGEICQCVGHVIHLPAGEGLCEILDADLERGRAGLAHCYSIWQWSWGSDKLPLTQPADPIIGEIVAAKDIEALRQLWRKYAAPTAEHRWTEIHAAAALQRMNQLKETHADQA